MKYKDEKTGDEYVITSWNPRMFKLLVVLLIVLCVLVFLMIVGLSISGMFAYRVYDQLNQHDALVRLLDAVEKLAG